MTATLEGVLSENAGRYWPHVREYIEQAVIDAANPWDANEVFSLIMGQKMQLWVIWIDGQITGVLVTEIYRTARGLTCAIPIVGGKRMSESMGTMETIKAWAKENGCKWMQGEGRSGWARALKPYGWVKLTERVGTEL